MELRRLDLGGIFQRALVLYARNFLRFAGIALASVVPVAIVQYVVLIRERPALDATLDVLQHPERLSNTHVPTLFNSPATLAAVLAAALFGYYLLAFAVGAVAEGVSRLYRGDEVAFRACYEAVLRRSRSIVAIVGIAILALVAAYTVSIVLAAIPLIAAAGIAGRSFASAVTVIVTAMVLLIGFALLCILVTCACALCATVIEGCSAIWSLQLTLVRVLNRQEFGRALLCALAVVAIALLASSLVDAAAFFPLARWPAAYQAVDAVERVIILTWLAVVMVVYYFDVRLRYEEFDLDGKRSVAAAVDEPVYAPTAYLSGQERAVIKRFLERRDSLAPQRRRDIAARLAAPVRERVPPELRTLGDEGLLERL